MKDSKCWMQKLIFLVFSRSTSDWNIWCISTTFSKIGQKVQLFSSLITAIMIFYHCTRSYSSYLCQLRKGCIMGNQSSISCFLRFNINKWVSSRATHFIPLSLLNLLVMYSNNWISFSDFAFSIVRNNCGKQKRPMYFSS